MSPEATPESPKPMHLLTMLAITSSAVGVIAGIVGAALIGMGAWINYGCWSPEGVDPTCRGTAGNLVVFMALASFYVVPILLVIIPVALLTARWVLRKHGPRVAFSAGGMVATLLALLVLPAIASFLS